MTHTMSRVGAGYSRRDFVKAAVAAGTGAVLAGRSASGQSRRQGRIDVHHHCRTAIQGGAGRGPGADWSPQKSIEQMDKFGIATSIISATVPAEPFYDGTEKSRTIARGIKDRMPAGSETRVPKGPMFELQKLYYEVAHATYPYPMAALRSFAPSSQILFGTDYPLEPIETTHVELGKLRLPADLQRAIDRTNAERLIPRLARPS